MPHFDIVKQNNPDITFRVSKIQADFDVKLEHSNEHFVGDIEMPNDWQIGVIVGASGTGKSTIAKELFNEELINGFEYKAKSVIDDMPKSAKIDDITKMFYSVGFGSVPSWLKPYDILDWLQPDWVFDTNKMQCFFGNAHDRKNNMKSENAVAESGQSLGVITI